MFIWSKAQPDQGTNYIGLTSDSNSGLLSLCRNLWFLHFKQPTDAIKSNWTMDVSPRIRNHFFGCEWYEVYDFLEFVAANYDQFQSRKEFCKACNDLFEREMSAYRFVDERIARLTENHEIAAIEQALESKTGPVRTHVQRALELLSDKSTPDYRNSIKESISAVESLVTQISGVGNGTLGQLIKKLEKEIDLHPALRDAFRKLYGYTSEKNGIRHAILEKNSNDYHDAKFMLVACSAFINYVEGKFGDK